MSVIRNLQYKYGINYKKDDTSEDDHEYGSAVKLSMIN